MAKQNNSRRSSRSNTQQKLSFRENMKAFRNIPPFFKLIWDTSPSLTLANIILRLIKSVIPVANLYVGKLIIDEIVLLIQGQGDLSYQTIWFWVGVEFGLVLASNIINVGINLVDGLLGDLFANESSIRLMKHATSLDMAQFENATFYDKLERARRQTTSRSLLISQILNQIQDAITVVFLGLGLVVVNFWLLLLLIITIIPSFISESYFNRSSYSLVYSWTPERRELDYLRYIGASDQTVKEVKIFGLANFITDRFALLSERYYWANRALAIKRSSWGLLFSSISTVGYYVAYVYIVWLTVIGTLSIGDLTFLSGSFNRIQSLMQGILFRFSRIAQDALYLQDLFDFFAIEPQIISPPNPSPIPSNIQKGFEFENVGFKYPNSDIWAVRNISFQLKSGEKLALVGENGAGKTTLVKLITRLYDPDEGQILLDGKNIRDYDIEEYRKHIGVIFQDFIRYQMIFSDNISIGKIDMREEQKQIEEAAALSLADTVVQRLPQGYKQMLGRRFEDGVDLSGGEWQKIALGRAYMRDAQLIILDEPTAALDARAEFEVFARFSELTAGKSAILISHRFSTVRMADRILVLQKGQLIELGTHEELLAQEGLYAELFNLQAEGYR